MQTVLVLFGGVSPEHAVSLVSAEAVLRNLNKENRRILPVGITLEGKWILFGGEDYKDIAEDIAANYLAGFEELLDDLAKYIHLHHPSIEKMFVLKKHFEHYQDYYKKLGNNESHKESMQVLVAMWKPLLNFLGIDVNKVAAGDYSELPDYKDSLNKLVSKYPALKKYGL